MKICVLQPSYERSELLRDYALYDPPRDLAPLAPLAPEWSVTHVFLHKATVYRQLKALKPEGFDVYVNLCEGHLEWDVPSIDVIHALDSLGLPYTGPNAALYEPRKESLKQVAHQAGVSAPRHILARDVADAARAAQRLRFPLFVKPNEGGDSFGIDHDSLCPDVEALRRKLEQSLRDFDAVLVEEFIGGREFSVLVAADPDHPHRPLAFRPVEFRFPEGESFKSYELKNAQYHPDSNVRVTDAALEARLMDAGREIFLAYEGVGYCRMDFRLDAAGNLHVLDANFTCSVFYPEGYFGTADYILQRDGFGAAAFLRHIVSEGVARHARRACAFRIGHDGGALTFEAARMLDAGEVIYCGEEQPQRLVSRAWAAERWSETRLRALERNDFLRADDIRVIPAAEPGAAPRLRRSSAPNLAWRGLRLVTLRAIEPGEELTVQD